MKARHLETRSGNPAVNQLLIIDDDGVQWFQSYKSIIGKAGWGLVTLDPDYMNYSRTTSRYLYQWLNVNSREFTANLKDGVYVLKPLNGQYVAPVPEEKYVPEWDKKGGAV